MSKPLTVGITGGIGSGKTLVAKLFSLLDIPVYNADARAKELTNSQLREPIINVFGEQSFINGKLNRDFMAQKVFNNKEQLAKLNSIVHPAVAIDFEKWVRENSSFEYVLKEAALLVEAGSYKQLDKLIVVTAPKKIRVERVKKRDPFRTDMEIEAIIDKQTDDDVKLKLADFVITNDESQLIIPQVLDIDKKIRQRL
ncbi:MAG: dephospho-CoA kinase [Cyclobacteriaceae bacterium]|nr:dephospho-CoA kinase [Cyclobacteriaceae bacterium]